MIPMPKAKPTQVIVHRIELQEKERDMFESVVAGQTVKNVIIPVAVAGGVGAAGYLGYKTLKEMYGWTEDIIQEWVDEYKNDPKVQGAKFAAEYGPAGGIVRGFKWFLSL